MTVRREKRSGPARRRAARADLDGAQHSIRVRRKYFCGSCGGWHLTSEPPPDWAETVAV